MRPRSAWHYCRRLQFLQLLSGAPCHHLSSNLGIYNLSTRDLKINLQMLPTHSTQLQQGPAHNRLQIYQRYFINLSGYWVYQYMTSLAYTVQIYYMSRGEASQQPLEQPHSLSACLSPFLCLPTGTISFPIVPVVIIAESMQSDSYFFNSLSPVRTIHTSTVDNFGLRFGPSRTIFISVICLL